MKSWNGFAALRPDLAEPGRALLYQVGVGLGQPDHRRPRHLRRRGRREGQGHPRLGQGLADGAQRSHDCGALRDLRRRPDSQGPPSPDQLSRTGFPEGCAAQRWCAGHQYVVRPPTTSRSSSAPSSGQSPPSLRSSMRSPMCEPPRRASWRSVARSERWSSPSSSSVSGVRRPGARPARQRISSASRLPTPARRSWSMSRALRGAAVPSRPGPIGERAAQLAQRGRHGVGPEPVLVGCDLERAEAPRVVHQEIPPVFEGDAGPHPLLVEDTRAVAQAVQGLVARRPPGRPSCRNARPAVGPPSVSSNSSFPRRRAEVKERPTRAPRSRGGVVPPRPYLESTIHARVMGRSSACSAKDR